MKHQEWDCRFNKLDLCQGVNEGHLTMQCRICGVTFEEWVAQEFKRLRDVCESSRALLEDLHRKLDGRRNPAHTVARPLGPRQD